uniref:Uncharacterized protein n=1 Tax=Panagrolaimus sp. ES5 TaxID=591445 RepID=A0AC34G3P3_9BILA
MHTIFLLLLLSGITFAKNIKNVSSLNDIIARKQAVCQDTEFECNNGMCILNWLQCNGIIDCPDGEDEIPRVNVCLSNQYLCHDQCQCIPFVYRCDGIPHCLDGSDEGPYECH